jgi:trk system potassium uptake protein TrkA
LVSIAIIGLGRFGCRVLEEFEHIDADIIIVDKDREIVEKYKDKARDAYITDAINDVSLKKIIPDDIDSVIIDLGNQLESSILVTNYLHKMGVKRIIVKALSDEHGEILKLVGATLVIYPDLDAAMRITPVIASSALFNYMQVSSRFIIAEVIVKDDLTGKTLAESKLRNTYNLNLIAYRKNPAEEFSFVLDPSFRFESDMRLLVAGSDSAMQKYLGEEKLSKQVKNKNFLSRLFIRK